MLLMLDVVGNPQVQSVSQSNSASNSPLGDKQDKVSSFKLTQCLITASFIKRLVKKVTGNLIEMLICLSFHLLIDMYFGFF